MTCLFIIKIHNKAVIIKRMFFLNSIVMVPQKIDQEKKTKENKSTHEALIQENKKNSKWGKDDIGIFGFIYGKK